MIGKERAILRARGSKIDTIVIIGKGGVNEGIIDQVRNAIKAREIIKCKVLDTAMLSARDAANLISSTIGAEVVCSIGNRFVLYKKKNEVKNKNKVKVRPKRVLKLRSGKIGDSKKEKTINRKIKYG